MTKSVVLAVLIFLALVTFGLAVKQNLRLQKLIPEWSQQTQPSPSPLPETNLSKAESCYRELKGLNTGGQTLPNPATIFCQCMGGTVTEESCEVENNTYSLWEYFDLMNPYDNTFTPSPVGYSKWLEFCQANPSSIYCGESITESPPPLTSQDRKKGWYWGLANQKKPGTPEEWVFTEAGRSSCWHRPDIQCY